MTQFPRLNDEDVWRVAPVLRMLRENLALFDDADCPYSAEVKSWFLRQVTSPNEGEVSIDDLDSEARVLFKQLKALHAELKEADLKDKLAYIKVGTALLEKLVVIEERATNAKAYAKFQNTVITVLEELCPPDVRTAVMDRLKDLNT